MYVCRCEYVYVVCIWVKWFLSVLVQSVQKSVWGFTMCGTVVQNRPFFNLWYWSEAFYTEDKTFFFKYLPHLIWALTLIFETGKSHVSFISDASNEPTRSNSHSTVCVVFVSIDPTLGTENSILQVSGAFHSPRYFTVYSDWCWMFSNRYEPFNPLKSVQQVCSKCANSLNVILCLEQSRLVCLTMLLLFPEGFDCRCGNLFCAIHRYSDKHDCPYDYRSAAADRIRKENPIVVAEKIQKLWGLSA